MSSAPYNQRSPNHNSGRLVVSQLCLNDVILGRGQLATQFEGNIRFREVVRSLLPKYIATNKRAQKDRLAREVINIIHSRQGRFLRKVESIAEAESLELQSVDGIWLLAEEELVVPKVKQTFCDEHSEPSASRPSRNNASPSQGPIATPLASLQTAAFSQLPHFQFGCPQGTSQVRLHCNMDAVVAFQIQQSGQNLRSVQATTTETTNNQQTSPAALKRKNTQASEEDSASKRVAASLEGLEILANVAARREPELASKHTPLLHKSGDPGKPA